MIGLESVRRVALRAVYGDLGLSRSNWRPTCYVETFM